MMTVSAAPELSDGGLVVGIVAHAFSVTLVLLLMKCLHSRCPQLRGCRGSQEEDEEGQADPGSLVLDSLSHEPCPKTACQEVEQFYRELHTPTGGRVLVKTLLQKLLVFMTKEVDHRGGCLMLSDMGISLEIPAGAVSLGRTERVSLVLVWDLSDSPSLQRSQALLSPVVYCGPHGTSFLQPCLLSFKHCGGNASQVRVYASDTALLPSKRWGEVGAQTKTCITRDECQVALTHFSLYSAVLEARDSTEAHKWLQLAMFASPLAAEQTHQQIRVYFLNNTPCALQWARCNEQPFLGQLCGPVQIFDFTSASSDMLLVLKYLSEGWENVDESASQSVPFLHIWHGRCPFRSFCFKRKQADCTQDSSEIIVTMHTYQQGQQGKYFEILRFHLSETGCHVESIAPKPYCNRMPRELFNQLQMLLEPSTVSGNDWTKLASHLGLCGMKIRFMSCQQSPAAAALEIYEEQNGSLQGLHDIMVAMERLDCAACIKGYLGQPPSPSPAGKKASMDSERDSGLIDCGSLEKQGVLPSDDGKLTLHAYDNAAMERVEEAA